MGGVNLQNVWVASDFWGWEMLPALQWGLLGCALSQGCSLLCRLESPQKRTEKWVRSGCAQTDPSGRCGDPADPWGWMLSSRKGMGGTCLAPSGCHCMDFFGMSLCKVPSAPVQSRFYNDIGLNVGGIWCRAGEGQGRVSLTLSFLPHQDTRGALAGALQEA